MSDPDFQPRTPFPGTWVPTGNVPADFAPEHNDTGTAADSDCDFREYSWTFGGNAAYFQNVFGAELHTTLDLNGKVVGISVRSDDNATVTIEGVGSVSSMLNHPDSGTFFKTDGSAYSGSFPLHITYNSIGGPWFLEVKIRVMDPFETSPPVEECSCDGSCGTIIDSNMTPIRFIGTKSSFEEAMIALLWRRLKYVYLVYSLVGAGILSTLVVIPIVNETPLYSMVFLFCVVFFFIWKGMPKTSKKISKILTNKIWGALPSGKIYLELDEEKGLKKVFSETDKPVKLKEKPILTKLECVCGHTVIFCNVGKRKNQIWFVADEDVTDFLNSWMKTRNLLCHEL
ncbi:MAG: hypothetical protein K6B46_00375 [Opitutales bacterium]|nr:hypothetical protein [Opitutales bacterium]